MQLNFDIKIKKELENNSNYSLANDQLLNQKILTNEFDSNSFQTTKYLDQDYILDKTKGASFILENILESFNIDPENISFIYISIQDLNNQTANENNLRFTLSIDNIINLNIAQFALFNIKEFNLDLSILTVDIPDTKKGLLKIIIGQK